MNANHQRSQLDEAVNESLNGFKLPCPHARKIDPHMRVKCWCSIDLEFNKIHFDQPESSSPADEEYQKMVCYRNHFPNQGHRN